MKNEDNFGDDCWLHAKEAARLVEERRKEVTHKYHKKAAKLQEEVEEDCEEKECKEVVVVLLGLPASGKSTLCRQLKERAVERGETVLTVDYDALIPLARQAKMVEEEGAWKKEREAIGQAVSSLLHQMHSNDISDTSSSMPYLSQLKESCLTLGKETKVTVLVDDNNYLSSMRKPWHRLARERSAGFCQIFVQASSEQAKAMNSMREAEERVPASVIDSMADRLEPPRPLVQAWEELSFTVSSVDAAPVNLDVVEAVVAAARRRPVPPLPDTKEEDERRDSDRQICSASMLHQADVKIRALVKDQISQLRKSGTDGAVLAAEAKRLGEIKVGLLERLRSGEAVLGEGGVEVLWREML